MFLGVPILLKIVSNLKAIDHIYQVDRFPLSYQPLQTIATCNHQTKK